MGESRGRGGGQGRGGPERQDPSPRGCRATGCRRGGHTLTGTPRGAGHQPLAVVPRLLRDFCRAEELALWPGQGGTPRGGLQGGWALNSTLGVPVLCRALSSGDPSTKGRKRGAPGCVHHSHQPPCLRPGFRVRGGGRAGTALQPFLATSWLGAEQPQGSGVVLGKMGAWQAPSQQPARPEPSWAWGGHGRSSPAPSVPPGPALSRTWAGNPGLPRSGRAGGSGSVLCWGLGGS